jgi:hypothetical protein
VILFQNDYLETMSFQRRSFATVPPCFASGRLLSQLKPKLLSKRFTLSIQQNENENNSKMKFAIVLLTILSAVPTTIQAAPIITCSEQSPCIDFTVAEKTTDTCDGSDCEFEYCMTVNLDNPDCDKSDTISHTCAKANDVCWDGGGFGSVVQEDVSLGNGWSTCQTVKPGGVAEFLLKDAAGGECATATQDFIGGGMSCETHDRDAAGDSGSCTGSGNDGKECRWFITAPATCGTDLTTMGGAPRLGSAGGPDDLDADADASDYLCE